MSFIIRSYYQDTFHVILYEKENVSFSINSCFQIVLRSEYIWWNQTMNYKLEVL